MNALLYMLDVALSLSDNRNLYILMDTSADKLLNDEHFYEKWIERLKLLATRDVSIHFIYSGYFLAHLSLIWITSSIFAFPRITMPIT